MKATHKYTEGKTNRQKANMALKAMSNLQGFDNGTISLIPQHFDLTLFIST